jgi:hypothetical protein
VFNIIDHDGGLWCAQLAKNVLISFSVLGSVVSPSDTDERIVEALDELQDFV